MKHFQSPPDSRVRRESFDRAVIAFHWMTAAAVIAMFVLAYSIERVDDPETAESLLTLHRSLGIIVWTMTMCRLVWRTTRAKLPAWPTSMTASQRWLARLNEYGLYGLLLLQPATGLLQSLYRARSFRLLGLSVPPVVARDVAFTRLMEHVHSTGAWLLAALVGAHAAAALFHLVVRRDGIFESMAPIVRRRSRRICASSESGEPGTRHGDGSHARLASQATAVPGTADGYPLGRSCRNRLRAGPCRQAAVRND